MRKLKYLNILIAVLAVQACCRAQDTIQQETDSLAVVHAPWQVDTLDGFLLKQYVFASGQLFGSNQILSLLEIPKDSPCKLAFAYDTVLTEVSVMAERHHALAAVNGSYFDMDLGNPICFLRIGGRIVGENTPGKNDSVHRKYYQYASIELSDKGHPRLVVPDSLRTWEYHRRCENIMTAGPMLLHKGHLVPQRDDRTFVTKRHNRTAMGIKADGTVVLLTVDGRFKGRAEGLTLPELEQLLRWLGCQEAINLDGGGSTTLYVQGGPYGGVVNYPSDDNHFDHAGQRPVSNIVMVVPATF